VACYKWLLFKEVKKKFCIKISFFTLSYLRIFLSTFSKDARLSWPAAVFAKTPAERICLCQLSGLRFAQLAVLAIAAAGHHCFPLYCLTENVNVSITKCCSSVIYSPISIRSRLKCLLSQHLSHKTMFLRRHNFRKGSPAQVLANKFCFVFRLVDIKNKFWHLKWLPE